MRQAPGKKQKQRVGGGGAQRAFMSEFLRGKRGYRTKEERSALFEEGKKEYKRAFGGAGAARYEKIGKAGTDSFKATGKAFCGFGRKRKSRALTEGPAFPCPPAESADAMQLVDLARASLREFSEQQPSDSTQQKKRRVAEDLSAVKAGSDERLRRGPPPQKKKTSLNSLASQQRQRRCVTLDYLSVNIT